MTERRWYAAAAMAILLVEVGIALFVRDRLVRPYGGDVLAVLGVYLFARAVTRWRWPVALAAALGVAVLVEVGQAMGVLAMVGLERVSVARTVMGTGFDWLDFVAYALGGLIVTVVERARER